MPKPSLKPSRNYQQTNQTMVDSKSWREDDLLDKIRQEEQMIAYLDEVNQSLSSLTMDSEERGD